MSNKMAHVKLGLNSANGSTDAIMKDCYYRFPPPYHSYSFNL